MSLKRIKAFFGRVRDILPPRRQWRTVASTDEPDVLTPKVLYLIGEQEKWAAVFLCPCGCQNPVWLNLLKGHRPRWSVTVSAKGVPNVSPSVDRKAGCRSHFILRSGRIVWCGRRRQR
jgi:hypothetical protein